MAPGPRAKGHDNGSPLTAWREKQGLTQRGLAEALGYSPSHVSKLESNGDAPAESFRWRLRKVYPGPDTERLCARWERAS